MNYPLARDARVTTHLRKSKRTGEFIARLPGEDRVRLICSDKRLWPPTGLDMNVLFQLLAEVQRTRLPQVTFTYAELLRQLGLTVQNQNRKALRPSWRLWSKLTLQFDFWHDPKKGKVVKVLPPPLVTFESKGKVTVTVHDDWVTLALAAGYYEPVPLPLLHRASDQNAALLVLTSVVIWQEDNYKAYHTRRQSEFAGKIGLTTKNRRARLVAAMVRVSDWFTAMGGELTVVYADHGVVPRGKIGFHGRKPKVPRPRQRELERSVRGSWNVAFSTPRGSWNVGTTYDSTYEVRNEAASAAQDSLRDRKNKNTDSRHPIRRSQSALNSKKANWKQKQNWKRKQQRLMDIAEAQSEDSIWNYGGLSPDYDDAPYGHPDPYADDM
jgi:hypothetical protein